MDIIALTTIVALFAVCISYLHGCDRLRRRSPLILNVVLLLLSALLLVYLVFALLRPEKF